MTEYAADPQVESSDHEFNECLESFSSNIIRKCNKMRREVKNEQDKVVKEKKDLVLKFGKSGTP